MTERLRELLHAEADTLHVPPAPVAAILDHGRSGRRHDRWTAGLVAAAVIGAVAAGGAAWRLVPDDDTVATPAGPVSAPAVYGIGSTVVVGDEVVEVPGSVHSFHYTGAGVLVRSNANGGASDGSGPESLTLVRQDGSTVSLGIVPEGVGPATDPDEPVYVLAEERDGGFVAVVRDAADGTELDVVPLPDLPPSYWEVPPLALDGQTLYVGYRNETVALDLSTGEQATVEGLPGGLPEVLGGRSVRRDRDGVTVFDVATGETLLTVPASEIAWGNLSPNGAFLELADMSMDGSEDPPPQVYDVATGRPVELPGGTTSWGWTSTGDPFRLDGATLTTCDAGTGDCSESPVPEGMPGGDLKVGGRTYES